MKNTAIFHQIALLTSIWLIRNASRYIRVKSVNLTTPGYLNNAGTAKDQYTGSIPMVGSGSYNGSFAGGVGNIIPTR